MKSFLEVHEWRSVVNLERGDPARAVCQIFVRWEDDLQSYDGEDLVVGRLGADLVLLLAPGLPMKLRIEEQPEIVSNELVAFGAEQIAPGLWSLNPSLNASGVIHAFVTLYGVPDPAPWQRLILVPR